MAQKKKTTSKKSTAKKKPAKKSTAKKTTKKKVEKGPEITPQRASEDREYAVSSYGEVTKAKTPVKKELWVLVFALISIFLMLCAVGLAGSVGETVKGFICGVFGIVGYIFPIFFAFATIYLVINFSKEGFMSIAKVLSMLIALVSVCIIASALDMMFITTSTSGIDYYSHGLEGFNGGFIGGTIAGAITSVIGNFATVLIFFFVLIMCFVFITGVSVLRPIKNQGKKIIDAAEEDRAYASASREVRRKEKKYQKRIQREEELAERMMAIGEDPAESRYRRIVGVELEGTDLKGTGTYAATGDTSSEVPFEEEMSAKEGEDRARAVAEEFKRTGKINIHRGNDVESVSSAFHDIPEDIEVKKINPSEVKTKVNEAGIDLKKDTDTKAASKSSPKDTSEVGPIKATRKYATQEELEALDKKSDTYNDSWDETIEDDSSFENIDIAEPEENVQVITPIEAEEVADDTVDIATSTAASISAAAVGGAAVASAAESTKSKATRTSSGSVTFNSGEVKKTRRPRVRKNYKLPSMSLLEKGEKSSKVSNNELQDIAKKLEQTLSDFGVSARVTDISCGPTVTRYELVPDAGVKISKIQALQNDIKLALAASEIRIEAPIPGKAAVGIEVPNSENATVSLRDIIETREFKDHPSKLAFGVGKDIGGDIVISDLGKMPHLLIAGATGSGKSVCLNTIIMSIIYRATPEEVKFIMIDPKQVELTMYARLPHMLVPVVNDVKKAASALNWGVAEMEERYNRFADLGVKDLKGYNEKIVTLQEAYDAKADHEEDDERPAKLPELVIIIDEMADLMMVAQREVETSISRLAQLARAAGIHLVLATQRPSRQVVTGLIKTNIPSRIALAVASGLDSRIILDMNGAENLLGKGDMLFAPSWLPKPVRIQGAFISDSEVASVVDFWATQKDESAIAKEKEISKEISAGGKQAAATESKGDTDELFEDCGRLIIEAEKASIGNLQRRFRIGFNRAARIMDELHDAGVVGPDEGKKAREILMTMEEFEDYLANNQ